MMNPVVAESLKWATRALGIFVMFAANKWLKYENGDIDLYTQVYSLGTAMLAGSVSFPWQVDIGSIRKTDSLRPPPFLIQTQREPLPPNPRTPEDLTYRDDEEPHR